MEFYHSNFQNISNVNERSVEDESLGFDEDPVEVDNEAMSEITRYEAWIR